MKKHLLLSTILIISILMTACGSEDNKSITETESRTIQTAESTNSTEAKDDKEISVEDVMSAEASPASDFEYCDMDDFIAIEKYIGNNPIVVIPDEIEGKPVKSVDGFANNKKVRAVILSDNVNRVSFSSFEWAENLEIFISGNGLERIFDDAFLGCKSLKTIILNEGLKRIGGNAFVLCNYDEISIPSTVEKVAFYEGYDGSSFDPVSIRVKKDSSADECLKQRGYEEYLVYTN